MRLQLSILAVVQYDDRFGSVITANRTPLQDSSCFSLSFLWVWKDEAEDNNISDNQLRYYEDWVVLCLVVLAFSVSHKTMTRDIFGLFVYGKKPWQRNQSNCHLIIIKACIVKCVTTARHLVWKPVFA